MPVICSAVGYVFVHPYSPTNSRGRIWQSSEVLKFWCPLLRLYHPQPTGLDRGARKEFTCIIMWESFLVNTSELKAIHCVMSSASPGTRLDLFCSCRAQKTQIIQAFFKASLKFWAPQTIRNISCVNLLIKLIPVVLSVWLLDEIKIFSFITFNSKHSCTVSLASLL